MASNASLVKNGIFNSMKVLSNLIFPVITFAYAARVLGDAGVGRVAFVRSIISYFTMIAMLGMNYYGTREAAKLREDKDKLSKFSQEVLFINGVTTLLAYVLLIAAVVFVPDLQGYGALLAVSSAAIVLQGMGMEWLYQALEEYRYIALRSILFQFIAFVALFLFVREPNDVLAYSVVLLTASSGSYLLNFVNARKYIRFRRYPHLEIKRHLKPVLWLFAMAVSIELYTVLDSTMLGFLQGDAAVGQYTAAVKVNKMMNSLITAAGAVMIPRFSYYVHHKEIDKVKSLVDNVYNFVFVLSVPIAVGLFMLSDEIILLFSGEGFAAAAVTMRILTPIVVIIPFSIVANQQIFVPMGKEKLILKSTLTGAATNFTFNMLLIPRYAQNGAAIATVVAELMVAIVCFINIGKFYDRKRIFSEYYQYWIASIPVVILCCLLRRWTIHYVFRMIIAIAGAAICYAMMLLLQKNTYFLMGLKMTKEKINELRILRKSA